MKIIDELLAGCYVIHTDTSSDKRGIFVKTYDEKSLNACGIEFQIKETFYSVSNRNVIRGMHFQEPPFAHNKIVQCARGEALDVLVDLRKGVDFGRTESVKLDDKNNLMIYIPKGLAHGFLATTDNCLMLYSTDFRYVKENDKGVRWDTLKFDWGIGPFILSERDRLHPDLQTFGTPFF